ncbi:MAG: transketolase [Nitrososphaeria archaeon]
MYHDEKLLKALEEKAKTLRKYSLMMIKSAGIGWLGGSFSEAEIVTALYFHHMRHDPKNPNWSERDRLVISKAHCCEMIYAALGEAGYFSKDEFQKYGRMGAMLQAHTDKRTVPGVEYSGGSLGEGLSFAVGQALAAKIDGASYRVYCIIGDGECDEGQIWEAAMFAAHHKLDNLTVLLDHNKFQSTGEVQAKIKLDPLSKKWEAFGWHVAEIDGHNLKQILDTLDEVEQVRYKPHIIICHTIKGKGVPIFEGKNLHFVKVTDEMYNEALKFLGCKE